jgi:GTP cyclohydrolase I
MSREAAVPLRAEYQAQAVPVSELIKARLQHANVRHFANDNIAEYLKPGELEQLQDEVEARVRDLLHALVIDTNNDHNTRDTARRVAKMYVQEVFAGRYQPRCSVTDFPNAEKLDEVYTVGPISVRSTCAHHLCPIVGSAWIGVVPCDRIIGLSKFNRVAERILARPQIQEEAVVQLADEIETLIRPRGLAVVLRATHLCMTWRGVKESGSMMCTSVMRGLFRENEPARSEFLSIIRGQGF